MRATSTRRTRRLERRAWLLTIGMMLEYPYEMIRTRLKAATSIRARRPRRLYVRMFVCERTETTGYGHDRSFIDKVGPGREGIRSAIPTIQYLASIQSRKGNKFQEPSHQVSRHARARWMAPSVSGIAGFPSDRGIRTRVVRVIVMTLRLARKEETFFISEVKSQEQGQATDVESISNPTRRISDSQSVQRSRSVARAQGATISCYDSQLKYGFCSSQG